MTTLTYTTTTTVDANTRMRQLYERHAKYVGYDPAGKWDECEYFSLLRLRGICHTVHVVYDVDGRVFLIVDLHTDGGPRTCAEISTPITSWGDALLTATRKVILGDAEIGESLTVEQRAALAATA